MQIAGKLFIDKSRFRSKTEIALYESNFLIEKLWTYYATLYWTFRSAIAHLSESEQTVILHNNASRLYRILRGSVIVTPWRRPSNV